VGIEGQELKVAPIPVEWKETKGVQRERDDLHRKSVDPWRLTLAKVSPTGKTYLQGALNLP
jgi:hypothetical protein